MSSLENISTESVTCLAFADSYTKKSGKCGDRGQMSFPMIGFHSDFCTIDPSTLMPTLWIGTSLGSVLTVSITLPETEARKAQPVLVTIMGKSNRHVIGHSRVRG